MVKQINVGYLIIEHPDGRTQEVLIQANRELTVGRSKHNNIILEGRDVARSHVLFKSWDSSVYAFHLATKCETLLNGKVLDCEARLESGDILVIGETRFRYITT